ncbi:MAG: sulfotransferase [Acidobacteriaceae bacterium]
MSQQQTIWPNFFAVGPPKAGTTSLYAHLKVHPQIFLPEVKEPNYFSTRPDISFEDYARLYRGAQGFPAVGDMTPFYLWDENTPHNIQAVAPAAKIIIMLRDPIARAYSHFLMYRRTGVDPEPSFESALRRRDNKADKLWEFSHEYIELGMYCGQVQRYQDVFGSGHVLTLLFDDLAKNPRELFARIACHIGVDPEPLEKQDVGEARNSFRMARFHRLYGIVRGSRLKKTLMPHLPERAQNWLRESPVLYGAGNKPQIDNRSRRLLQDIYDPDISRLEKLLGQNLPELRNSWV